MWLFRNFVIPELNTYTAEVLETVLSDLPNSRLAWYGFNIVLLLFRELKFPVANS